MDPRIIEEQNRLRNAPAPTAPPMMPPMHLAMPHNLQQVVLIGITLVFEIMEKETHFGKNDAFVQIIYKFLIGILFSHI
jgi:hypothetical protein